MTDAETHMLVFKDQAGEYYLLPQETLERGRVPAEHKTEVQRVFAEAGGDDVAGHLGPIGIAIIMGIGIAAWEIGGALGDAYNASRPIEQAPLPGPGGIPTGSPETIRTGGGPQRI